ncbi:MAG: hypothetical protein JRH18_19115 [Deltaproteobacteria bacterium]|nr:hypothetical protein [Deltaproteobacteria bacterium]
MRIKILESAKEDLKEGFHFYEPQEKGVGSYFLESLFSGIEYLRLYAGIHGIHFGKYYRIRKRGHIICSV